MNITKVALGSGAAVLAIAAVFAAKPKAAILQVFYTVANACKSFSLVAGTTQFTTGSALTQAQIKTSGGTSRNLWKVCSGVPATTSIPVHFRH